MSKKYALVTLKHHVASDVVRQQYEYRIDSEQNNFDLGYVLVCVYSGDRFMICLTADVKELAEYIFFVPEPDEECDECERQSINNSLP